MFSNGFFFGGGGAWAHGGGLPKIMYLEFSSPPPPLPVCYNQSLNT